MKPPAVQVPEYFNTYPSVQSGVLTAQQAFDTKEYLVSGDTPTPWAEISEPKEKIIYIERKMQMTHGFRMGLMFGKHEEKKTFANALAQLYVKNKIAPSLAEAQAQILAFTTHWGTEPMDDKIPADPLLTAAALGWPTPEKKAEAPPPPPPEKSAEPEADASPSAAREQPVPRTVSALMKKCIAAEQKLKKTTDMTGAKAIEAQCVELRQQLEAHCGEKGYEFDKAREQVERKVFGANAR